MKSIREILSRDLVAIEGVGFIALFDTARDYTLQFSITHTLVSAVTFPLPLLGSGFQRRIFPFLRVSELSPASASSFSEQQHTTSYYQSQIYVTTGGLPPISSSWRQTPWGSREEFFFFWQLNPCGHSPYITFSLTWGWVCLLWISFTFVKCTYRTYSIGLHGYGECLFFPGNSQSDKSDSLV
jgi:hypothetical protein